MTHFRKNKLIIDDSSRLFFTADLHFCHSAAIEMCQRPFKNIQEMNDVLIQNWRNAVSDLDDIVVLGDIFWKKSFSDKYLSILKNLTGNKHLVLGNHDYFDNEWYLQAGFTSVQPYLEIIADKVKINCFHYPMYSWNGSFHGTWHLYGHTHGKFSHPNPKALDVGVDAHNFTPVKWLDIYN